MTEGAAIQPIRLAVDVAHPALADRLVALLASVPGLRLVAPGEPAEALVIASATVAQADEDAIRAILALVFNMARCDLGCRPARDEWNSAEYIPTEKRRFHQGCNRG